MGLTEVVQATDHIHAGFQGLDFASQAASAAGQAVETLAKGGIETFYEGRIDRASALGLLDEGFDHPITALHNAA